MRNLALADVTPEDIRAMRSENETLFVEHKTAFGSGGESFQVAKAVCSFANSLGGWVLVGITDGEANAGRPGGWEPLEPHQITDRVREALRASNVDPVPSFAATVRDDPESGSPIGLIRVYESADSPHVLGNGQVLVRSVAEDTNMGRKYRPGGVDTQAALLALAARGSEGRRTARSKLDPNIVPLAAGTAGLGGGSAAQGRVGLRAVPLNGSRLEDWAVSERSVEPVQSALRVLARRDDEIPLDPPSPYASGLTFEARSNDLLGPEVGEDRDGLVQITVDAAGVVAVAMVFGVWEPPRPGSQLTLNGLRDLVIRPLLAAAATVLAAADAHGRALVEMNIGFLQAVVTLSDQGQDSHLPAHLPLGGEWSLPLTDDRYLGSLADQWRSDVGRAAGYLTLRS